MLFIRITALLMLSFSAISAAFNPTPEQIEQFSKLPKAQQEALAKQYGIDLSTIRNLNTNSAQTVSNNQKNTIKPRNSSTIEEQEDELKPVEHTLKPFGYDIFSGEPTSFAPGESAEVTSDYVIGRGDAINITLYGKESASHTLVIDNEGRLSIPNFSPVQVAGLTYEELKQLIKNKISQEAIGLNVFVAMSQLRSMRVMIVGETYKPGSYTVSPLSTVTHALYVSGGLTEIASLRNIQVKRQGKTIATLDLYDLLLEGDSSGDVSLRSGDVVFVPSVGSQVKVEGAVKREGIFELKDDDTVDSLIKMFGGFKDDAFLEQVQVKRVVENSRQSIISVDFINGLGLFKPKGGDSIKVKSVKNEVVDSITLIGAVARPGHYEWSKDLAFDNLIKSIQNDLLPQADLGYAIIVRQVSKLGEIEVIQFSIADALNGKRVFLNKNDEVYVFSRFQTQEEEDKALTDLALTKDEKELQERVKLWHLYETRQFEEKVMQWPTSEEELGLEATKLEDTQPEENLTVFGRTTLLETVISRLEYQSTVGHNKAVFEVSGEVKFPGVYPLANNTTTYSAIQAAGGLLESAFVGFAEVTRAINDGNVRHIRVEDIDAQPLADALLLKSRDTLNVLMRPDWQASYKVHLAGEVTFPGTYTVKRGDTLEGVIKRAGGLTKYAEPRAAIFTREAIKEQEKQQLLKLSEELRKDIASKSFQKSIGSNTSLSYEETDKLLKDLASVEALGRLVINLPSILAQQDTLSLQDGDSLYIPGKQESISIIGEVNYSSSHLFKRGTSIDDYINLSGGLKDRADEDKVYVIKANGAVYIPNRSSWFAVNNQHNLEPGDTIVVPMDASYMDNLTLWSTATQIFYQLGVGIAAIARI
ncbi:SLBB domain-containing protein [Pseudoalteromonas umbrosa]|uniref:SLBB domain-containing protein n=1 Tax=Pseudoalteromonas umbrosa TaxID=3048489 RepID=UPI0024C2D6CD|nr:SLBB domain-containing protein [Pseudoalteromonas sp. B95]MDK1289591.1 SLBB domain-containing protein [Pseudoalteromonas sp. B95]